MCACCLEELDPWQVRRTRAAFCSAFCQRRADDVRYDRRAIRDGRIVRALQVGNEMMALVIFRQHINFYALNMAYVHPRVTGELREQVLAVNGGLCMYCGVAPATEVDHITDGSNDLSNLQGLCRTCHELKPRPPIPADLTHDQDGVVDETDYPELTWAWHDALFSAELYQQSRPTPAWQHLTDMATIMEGTRFGKLTLDILDDNTRVPADRDDWAHHRTAYARDTRDWAVQLTGRPEPTTAEIRAWASAHDLPVSPRGRLPHDILDAYHDAH